MGNGAIFLPLNDHIAAKHVFANQDQLTSKKREMPSYENFHILDGCKQLLRYSLFVVLSRVLMYRSLCKSYSEAVLTQEYYPKTILKKLRTQV